MTHTDGSAAITVSDDTFAEAVLQSTTPVLVDFWASWCGPCTRLAPVLDEVADETVGRLVVAKLDVEANPETAAAFRVISLPTMILFYGGEPVQRIAGASSKPALLEALSKAMV